MCFCERGDHKLSLALNGETALQVAARTPPDLVLLDIVMPGMDGYEVCRRLRQMPETAEVPIMSGDDVVGAVLMLGEGGPEAGEFLQCFFGERVIAIPLRREGREPPGCELAQRIAQQGVLLLQGRRISRS